MSRRPNAAADKAANNQQAIKSLLKLPANRICSDCKRNKLPRWASWNIGVFICIRCSGIHRGMGTHISRVKSVDLDSWTDEQLQSMIKWGNARANKYWEANLAPGHVPSEAKIENFIRTKYESKRWVMEGGIPDPSTLDDSDEENVPLKLVQQKLESRQQTSAPPPPKPQPRNVNLFDDDDPPLNVSSSKSTPTPVKADQRPASGQQTKPADSLLGLDFFGPAASPVPRPASVGSNPASNAASRPDLNRSILSLYAAAPRPQLKSRSPTSSFSTPFQSAASQQSGLGGLDDAFGNLSFVPQLVQTSPVQSQKSNAFANLTVGLKKTAASPQMTTSSGGFFSPTPSAPKPAPAPAASPSGVGDLFDLGAPAPSQSKPTYSQSSSSSAFNLDNTWATPFTNTTTASAAVSSNDIWGSSSANAWCSPAVSTAPPAAPAPKAVAQIKDDDDWGSFSSGPPAKASQNKFGGDDDLFRNVWS